MAGQYQYRVLRTVNPRNRKRRFLLVQQLDSGQWVIRADAAPHAPRYESREAAVRALELSEQDRRALQGKACPENEVVLYHQVVRAISAANC